MFWYGVLPCAAAVIAVGVLTKQGRIPYDIGTPIWVGGIFVTLFLNLLDNRLRRKRQFGHYRDAGFVVAPKDGSHIDAFAPFPGALYSRRPKYIDGHYWLPSAPDVRVYDIVRAGHVRGHVITRPTSAPPGLVARELPADQVRREVQLRGPMPQLSTGADGVLRSSGTNCEMLVSALPLQPGVLVVMPPPWRTAHWRTHGALTADEIRSAIKALQRLPAAAETTDEIWGAPMAAAEHGAGPPAIGQE